jgi:2-amino-4-hydroxy-6-hydroxymethyldihydropteridine diphosphokinase
MEEAFPSSPNKKTPGYRVCILLGSNIQPEHNLRLAMERLRKEMTVLQTSSVWESAPVGGSGANFLNAAVLAVSKCQADSLKQGLLRPLEASLGRVRSEDKNMPRPIDLDIIFFENQLLDPTVWDYAYKAVPVSEIKPEFLSEGGKPLKEAAARLAVACPVRLRTDVKL